VPRMPLRLIALEDFLLDSIYMVASGAALSGTAGNAPTNSSLVLLGV